MPTTRSERSAPSAPGDAPPPPSPQELAAIEDAIPRAEPLSKYGNPASYEVFGRRYVLLPTADGYLQRGTASWYGPGFHGKRTSSGEPYDMYAMTAAHKTLPIPAYARVTHLGNGRSVVVRINDRGPFVGDRLIDLSYAAAWKLDMLGTGTAAVEVRVLTAQSVTPMPISTTAQSAASPPIVETPPPATDSVPSVPATSGQYLQIGAFGSRDNALRLLAQLRSSGFSEALLREPVSAESPLYKVQIGPLGNALEVNDYLERLLLLGIQGARIVEQ